MSPCEDHVVNIFALNGPPLSVAAGNVLGSDVDKFFLTCVLLRRGEINKANRTKLKEDRDEKKKDMNKLEKISKHDRHTDAIIKNRQWMASWSLSLNDTQVCTHT